MKWGSHWRFLSRDISDVGFKAIVLLAQWRKGWAGGEGGSREAS